MASIAKNSENNEAPVAFYKMELAGKKIEVECIYRRIVYFCRDYISKFDKPDFIIHISKQDIVKEKQKQSNCLYDHMGNEVDLSEYYEIAIAYQKILKRLLYDNIIMLHGAAVAINNKCYVFTAPSGVGKTTHIKNWLKMISGSFVVNGDKPVIDVERKIVYGTPWCGKEGLNVNTAVPLAGIIYLERGDINSITPIKFHEMLPIYIQQFFIPQEIEMALKVYQLIGELKDVPCYRLVCNKDKESAEIAYKGLCEA